MIHNLFLGGWCGRTALEFYHDLVRLDFIIITMKLVSFSNIKTEQTASSALFFMRRI